MLMPKVQGGHAPLSSDVLLKHGEANRLNGGRRAVHSELRKMSVQMSWGRKVPPCG